MTRSPASEGELQRRAGRGLPVAGASVALAVVFYLGVLPGELLTIAADSVSSIR